MNKVIRSNISLRFIPSPFGAREFKFIAHLEINNIKPKDDRVGKLLNLVNKYYIKRIKLVSYQINASSLLEIKK